MRRLGFAGLMVLLASSVCFANSAPQVTQVTMTPLSGGLFTISYQLVDADNDRCTITVMLSTDNGSTWSPLSSSSLTGVLTNVQPGSWQITWDSKITLPGLYRTQCRIRIIADDGKGAASPSIVWVSISNPGFVGQMSKFETTNAQFAQYLNAALASNHIRVEGSYVKGNSGPYSGQNYYRLDGPGFTFEGATNGGKSRVNYSGGTFTVDSGFGNHPVTYVSWYGATAFASYYGWRLPTEWEWQAVASFNGAYTYGCGNTINNNIANYRGSHHPHGTTPVGQYGVFGYGMADMAGNVWEWASSLWSSGSSFRVIRGGGWGYYAYHCSVSFRTYRSPNLMYSYHGFRVCR